MVSKLCCGSCFSRAGMGAAVWWGSPGVIGRGALPVLPAGMVQLWGPLCFRRMVPPSRGAGVLEATDLRTEGQSTVSGRRPGPQLSLALLIILLWSVLVTEPSVMWFPQVAALAPALPCGGSFFSTWPPEFFRRRTLTRS